MKSIILWHNSTLLLLLLIRVFYSASKVLDADVPTRTVADKKGFKLENHHSGAFKEKAILQNHRVLLGWTQDLESVAHEISDQDETLEGSNDYSASGSGGGKNVRTESVEQKLKGFIEEEAGTKTTTLGEKAFSFTDKTDNNLPQTTPNVVGSGTSIAGASSTATENKNINSTVGYSEGLFTKAMTLEDVESKRKPTMVVKKPASFLNILHEIRQELDELLKWKREHERKVHNFAVFFGKTFKQRRFSKQNGQADKDPHWEHQRMKRSKNEDESGLSKEILKKIEANFPCRHPHKMTLIESGTSFFNKQECSQCRCHMGKLSCKKDLEKCYPKACHLLDREILPNLAIHNDGCNNCLCYFGKLICTHLRCPEAGHRYTNYQANGLENIEPENFSQHSVLENPSRSLDTCLECDRMPGPYVCGKKQWKTFPTLCHAMFCGENKDNEIYDHTCETLDPCISSPCGKDERCVPYYQTPCLAGENTTSLCQQYKCIPNNRDCSKDSLTTQVCGVDGKSYSNECEMLSKGVQLAYRKPCKKNCNSEVCGLEGRTYASRCHAKEINAYIDYRGVCEYHFTSPLIEESDNGESFFTDQRCDLVYEHGRCGPIKCETAVTPPGACCPVCGSALVVSLNLKKSGKDYVLLRVNQMHAFITALQSEVSPHFCKISIDLTYTMDILVVIQPYKINELEACADMASEIVDKINFERDEHETEILSVLGSATMIKEKPFEKMKDITSDDLS